MNPYSYIKDNSIILEYCNFKDIYGICAALGNTRYIGVRNGLGLIKEREVLAHEIGHIHTDTINNKYCGKYFEQLAEKSGAEFLIPTHELLKAIEDNSGICDIGYLAPLFGVSFDYMKKRIEYLGSIKL